MVGYDRAEQAALLKNMLGTFSIERVALLVAGLFAAIGLFWLLVLGLTQRPPKEALEHRLYRRFCEALAKHGVQRDVGVAPSTFAAHAAQQLPALAGVIREFTQVYEGICYAPTADGQNATRRLKALLAKVK